MSLTVAAEKCPLLTTAVLLLVPPVGPAPLVVAVDPVVPENLQTSPGAVGDSSTAQLHDVFHHI